jgi:cell surface protein SprA
MPLNSSLIRGAQSLFGVKPNCNLEKQRLQVFFSEQNHRQKCSVTRWRYNQDFDMFALDYDSDRHFFLSQYFRNKYDSSLKTIHLSTVGFKYQARNLGDKQTNSR